jgi:hypothetical protein
MRAKRGVQLNTTTDNSPGTCNGQSSLSQPITSRAYIDDDDICRGFQSQPIWDASRAVVQLSPSLLSSDQCVLSKLIHLKRLCNRAPLSDLVAQLLEGRALDKGKRVVEGC